MTELRVAGLRKSFGGQPVLRGVDLSVTAGRLVAILGASGSGKTTLLRLLSGFERADAGAIQAGGRMLSGPGVHLRPEQRQIGYVAQEGALFPHLSVADNIAFGLSRRQRRRHCRVAELLELVGLPSHYASRAPQMLSGGEQQRVALARSLAPGPALVLLDEPFSSLDAALRVETREAVAAALSAAGTTALLVTHDQSEALSMGSAVAVLRQGRLVQVASPDVLYRFPLDADLARFVGEAVLLPGIAESDMVRCSLGRLPLAVGIRPGDVQVMLRPEQIRVHASAEPGAARAQVTGITYYGHDARVGLALPDGLALTARVSGYMIPRAADLVWVTVEGAAMAYANGQQDDDQIGRLDGVADHLAA